VDNTKKIPTNIEYIDTNLDGGINPETITLIYGEPKTGKSTLTTQCAFNCVHKHNLKTLYIDCDNTFSSKRLNQIAAEKFDSIADKIILIKPLNFKEQTTVIDHITDYTTHNFGLLIIDTINSLYSVKHAETPKNKAFDINRELNRQMAILAQTTKIQKIPIIINSQVRNIFNDPAGNIKPAANRVLTFWADNIISLKPTETKTIKITIEKNNKKPTHQTCYAQIGERGIFAINPYQ
jgi:RecA/RadA recombinase